MEIVPDLILVVGVVLSVITVVVILILYLTYWSLQRRAESLLSVLPPMCWLTLETVIEYGYSELLSRTALCALYEHGFLEVRLRSELWHSSERPSFVPAKVHQFEFRVPHQPEDDPPKKQRENKKRTHFLSHTAGDLISSPSPETTLRRAFFIRNMILKTAPRIYRAVNRSRARAQDNTVSILSKVGTNEQKVQPSLGTIAYLRKMQRNSQPPHQREVSKK